MLYISQYFVYGYLLCQCPCCYLSMIHWILSVRKRICSRLSWKSEIFNQIFTFIVLCLGLAFDQCLFKIRYTHIHTHTHTHTHIYIYIYITFVVFLTKIFDKQIYNKACNVKRVIVIDILTLSKWQASLNFLKRRLVDRKSYASLKDRILVWIQIWVNLTSVTILAMHTHTHLHTHTHIYIYII